MSRLPSLAILGATSRMARDFIPRFQDRAQLHLFARRGDAHPYEEFPGGHYDAIVNFVGIGDPARTREMGEEIISVTRHYDMLALDYQARHPGTRYVFLSSGAAYGGDFLTPARDGGETPVAPGDPQHHYAAAKQEAEARHRALSDRAILDLRVFNYVSRTMDLSAHYLLAEMVRCTREGRPFRTADRPLTRDFLHPDDFAQIVACCIGSDANMALDCYSQAPITKRQMLSLMETHFGMVSEITQAPAATNVTGEKPHYYSESRRAADLGYAPAYSTHSAIVTEVGAILAES